MYGKVVGRRAMLWASQLQAGEVEHRHRGLCEPSFLVVSRVNTRYYANRAETVLGYHLPTQLLLEDDRLLRRQVPAVDLVELQWSFSQRKS